MFVFFLQAGQPCADLSIFLLGVRKKKVEVKSIKRQSAEYLFLLAGSSVANYMYLRVS